MVILSSCFPNNTSSTDSDNQIANKTFEQIINAIYHQDKTELKNLFSKCVCDQVVNFEQSMVTLLEIFQGEELSYNDDKNVGADMKIDNGNIRKELQSAYEVKTSKQKYYVAVKECISDTFDPDRVGVLSLYIINAENWHEPYIYRGDGKWTLGINIDNVDRSIESQ